MPLSPDNKRRETYKAELSKLLATNPSAHQVVNRYKVINFLLHKEWSNTLSSVDKKILNTILRDVVYLDRKLRKETEGDDEELKEILSQEYQINELGVEVGTRKIYE